MLENAPREDEVYAALSGMKAMLWADGYELGIVLQDGKLALRISATDNACAECLVPKSNIVAMVSTALERAGVRTRDLAISVMYPLEAAEARETHKR